MKNLNQAKQNRAQSKMNPRRKDSQALLKEDLERWRGESPAAGQVAEAKQEAQASANAAQENWSEKRNSAEQTTPDVTAQNWSAEELAEQSVYEDEATLKAQMKEGKKTRQANAK